MFSSVRIDITGIMISCLGHVVIMGGAIAASASSAPPQNPTPNARSAMLVSIVSSTGDAIPKLPTHKPLPGNAPLPQAPSAPTSATTASLAAPVSSRLTLSPSTSSENALRQASDNSGVPSAVELNEYQRQLYEIVARNSRYPREARQMRLAGITHLAFRLDRAGNVLESWIHHSSGSVMLDQEALAALERSRPLPPIPSSLPARMEFVIEIDASLQQVALRTN